MKNMRMTTLERLLLTFNLASETRVGKSGVSTAQNADCS